MPSKTFSALSSMLFVPTNKITALSFVLKSISPFNNLHKICCVLSPPIPKFIQCNALIFSLHKFVDNSPCIIESPINNISDSDIFASDTYLLC